VRIIGVVVAIDDFANLRAYTIDDSSGACIEAIISVTARPKPAEGSATAGNESTASGPPIGLTGPPPTPYDHIDVGCVVDVKGALSMFRDEKQIKVEKMLVVKGTNDEVKLWEKRARFREEVLGKPWMLEDKTIRRCRREAERSAAEGEKKAKMLKDLAKGKTSTLPARDGRRREAVSTTASKTSSKDKSKRRAERRDVADDVARLLSNSEGKYSALGV
jgi:endo-1,3(4)-beta-glucanase